MQRVRMSLPYYRENSWDPVVLAVDSASHGGSLDASLLTTIPADVTIYRVRAWSLSWTRWFGLGNLGWRSWWRLLMAGVKIIRREKIDLVFISNTQFVTFTLGRIWRRWLGVPYVIDLQDPWLTHYYTGSRLKERPGGWKYSLAHWQAGVLEGWSLRRMSAIMSVSPNYLDDLRQRYTWFGGIPSEVIGFGASEADFIAARALPPPSSSASKPIRIVSTGAAGPIMQSALQILFDALATLQPRPAPEDLRFEFIGTSYAGTAATPSVLPLAHIAGVDSLVSESPLRLGLLEALRAQIDAHALLLLGSMDPAYSASKLYPYFLSGRPVLAIVLKGSVLETQLRDLSFATVITYDESGPSAETRGQIQYFLQDALAGFPSGQPSPRNETVFRQRHLAPALTSRQCSLFERACAKKAP